MTLPYFPLTTHRHSPWHVHMCVNTYMQINKYIKKFRNVILFDIFYRVSTKGHTWAILYLLFHFHWNILQWSFNLNLWSKSIFNSFCCIFHVFMIIILISMSCLFLHLHSYMVFNLKLYFIYHGSGLIDNICIKTISSICYFLLNAFVVLWIVII